MKITLNGQPVTLTAPLNLPALLSKHGYDDMTIAVARNGAFVPKSTYEDVHVEDGDEIEIVAPMQGG